MASVRLTTNESRVEHDSRRERLTDKRLEKLVALSGQRLELSDTIVPELRVRVSERGTRSWSVIYRVAGAGEAGRRGKMCRMTLGKYPLVTVDQAREKAREALGMAERGADPVARRHHELAQRKTRTFEAVFDRFVELHVKQNTKEGRFAKDQAARAQPKGGSRGRCAAERIIADNALPIWRERLIETITRAEAHDLLDDVVTIRGEPLARELRKHLTKLFNWAADRGHMAASPLAGMRRPELGYVPRERVLSMDELGRVWHAAGKAAYPFGPMVRLLILTGQRRSEVAELERGQIDEEQHTVEIPASRYKTKRPHVYPLSAPAWALMETLPKWNNGNCVFSTTGGRVPISGFSKAKFRLDELITKAGAEKELSPLLDWTLHDLRRSVATHMARLGVPQEHIERVLGHAVPGVAGTYNRYTYLDEKRAALEIWGRLWN